MFVANSAASRKVNPEGASVKLTAEQVWKGLELKARDPAKFIKGLESAEIINDSSDVVARKLSFSGKPEITEDLTLFPNVLTYAVQRDNKATISNIISYDESNELILTLCYAGGSSSQGSRDPAELNKLAGANVESTLTKIRELVQDGTIA